MNSMFGKRSHAKEKIINTLLKGEKPLTQISEKIGISKQTTLNHLNELEERGIIKSYSKKKKKSNIKVKIYKIQSFSTLFSIKSTERGGYAINFQANTELDTDFPLLNQIPQEKYREDIKKYLKNIKELKHPLTITIFGSVARGKATWKSDIDAALFSDKWTKEEKDKVLDEVSKVNTQGKVEASLNPHFKKYSEKDKITKEIYKGGLLIHTTREDEELWEKMKEYQTI